MTEIRELFYAYLDPNNPNPDESGKALLEQFCSSIDVLFEIIQNEALLRRPGAVFLKRVIDLQLEEINAEGRQEIFAFVTMELIPNILPQDPNYLSPIIYEVFSKVAQSIDADNDSLNEYIKNLSDPVFLPFIIIYLNNLDPSFIDLESTCEILVAALEIDDEEILKLCVYLFVVLCNNFPSSPVFSEFYEKILQISVEKQSTDIWNALSDLSIDFTPPFMEAACSIFTNESFDFEFRGATFFFYCDNFNINIDNYKELPQLLEILVDFQVTNLNEYDAIDPSLFILYPKSLEIAEMREETFELIKVCSFELLSSESEVHQVVGLYSLEFLIDNSHEMALIEDIPKDLSIFHPFLTSENPQQIGAAFEVLKIIIGKPIGAHFNFEPIFQDVIFLFLNGDDDIRNRAAIFSYKFLHSHFSSHFFIFELFIQVIHMVKNTELPIYLEILADSILPNTIFISDQDIDNLVEISTEIFNSNRDFEDKVSAASLCCSLIVKDADLTFRIGQAVLDNAFQAICQKNRAMRKTMSTCLIRFIKCTNGILMSYFSQSYEKIFNCSIINGKLSLNYEPILLTEMIKRDPDLPEKDEFLSLLVSTILEPPDEKQYKIAAKCLKKIVASFDINAQIELATHICEVIFDPSYFKLIRSNYLILSAMLKEKNPLENRIQIAQIVSEILNPFPDRILKDYIGSICKLTGFVIGTIGPNLPDNIKEICVQLFEKTTESPLFYTTYNFFLFSYCIRYSEVDPDTFVSTINSAFEQLNNEDFTNLDAGCCLLCIKAGIEKNPEILDEEKMQILTNCWEIMLNDPSMILSKCHLAEIFILLGCHDLIPTELFVSAIQVFPMELRFITGEVCQMFLDNFQNVDNRDRIVLQEIFFGIIRLLGAGRTIRYAHKIELNVIISLIRLGLELAEAIGADPDEAIRVCLPESPRKQVIIAEFFANARAYLQTQGE